MTQVISGLFQIIFSSLNAEFIIYPVAVAAVFSLVIVTFEAVKGRG